MKNNIELFRSDQEYDQRFFKIINNVNEQQQKYLWLFKDVFIYSKRFGEFIYDNQLLDIAKFFSRDFFINHYTSIIQSLLTVGTFQSYIAIIKGALGATNVLFETPAPSHLIITITLPTAVRGFAAYDNFKNYQVIANGSQKTSVDLQFIEINKSDFIAEKSNVFYDVSAKKGIPAKQKIVFKHSLSPLLISETLKMIEMLNVNGVFVEIFISK